MAVELQGLDIGFLKASADLSDYQFLGVKISADFTVAPATAGDCDGVLQNKPEAAGRACQVRKSGASKVVLAGTVAAGQPGKTNAAGAFVVADTDQDQYAVRFVEGGDSGETVTALVENGYFAT